VPGRAKGQERPRPLNACADFKLLEYIRQPTAHERAAVGNKLDETGLFKSPGPPAE
jgi:hypothetical protein